MLGVLACASVFQPGFVSVVHRAQADDETAAMPEGDADDSDGSGDEDLADQDPGAHDEQAVKASKSSGFAVMFFPMDGQAKVGKQPPILAAATIHPPPAFSHLTTVVAGRGGSPASIRFTHNNAVVAGQRCTWSHRAAMRTMASSGPSTCAGRSRLWTSSTTQAGSQSSIAPARARGSSVIGGSSKQQRGSLRGTST